ELRARRRATTRDAGDRGARVLDLYPRLPARQKLRPTAFAIEHLEQRSSIVSVRRPKLWLRGQPTDQALGVIRPAGTDRRPNSVDVARHPVEPEPWQPLGRITAVLAQDCRHHQEQALQRGFSILP